MTGTLHEDLGGAVGLRRVVDRFYDIMEDDEGAALIRDLHAEDLTEARDKLYMFLSGWTGGPPLYLEKYGHPRLRARHLPFPIGVTERDQWLACMRRALEEEELSQLLRDQLMGALFQTADFMRNLDEAPEG